MPFNIYAVLVATLVPTAIGFLWYNPKTPMGALWMKETNMTDEKMKGANMPLIFGLSLVFSFLLAFQVTSVAIHQMAVSSLLMNFPDVAEDIIGKYATEFRTFGHGALHGFMMGLCVALPILATNAMFERRSWKYIWVNVGYWVVTLTLMGGIICAWQ